MAITVNLNIDQGADFSTVLTLQDDNGNATDLTGSSIYSQFRKSYGSVIGHSFVVTTPSPTSGAFTLGLSAAASSAIKAGRYLYDVEITSSSGGTSITTRVIEGVITITPQITKLP